MFKSVVVIVEKLLDMSFPMSSVSNERKVGMKGMKEYGGGGMVPHNF